MLETIERVAKNPRVLAIPFPAKTHCKPFLRLCEKLISHDFDLSLTVLFFSITSRPPKWFVDEFSNLKDMAVILPIPIPIQGEMANKSIPKMAHRLQSMEPQLQQWIEDNPYQRPTCIVSDFYMAWTHRVASHLGIPRVVFHNSSALGVLVDETLWEDLPHLSVSSNSEHFRVGPLVLSRALIPRSAKLYRRFDPVSEFLRENRTLNSMAWGALINTTFDLEMADIQRLFESRKKRTGTACLIWPIGPLYSTPHIPKDYWEDCCKWMDSQTPNSVLYVALGDDGYVISKVFMVDIIRVLQALNRPCVWEVSYQAFMTSKINEDCSSMIKVMKMRDSSCLGVGIGHPSVGAVLTHGEWNLALKCMDKGVPVITWPIEFEHSLTSMIVVDRLKFGVTVNSVMDDGEESRVPRIHGLRKAVGKAMEMKDKTSWCGRVESDETVVAFIDAVHRLQEGTIPL